MLFHSFRTGEEIIVDDASYVIVNILDDNQLVQLRNKNTGVLLNRTRAELHAGYVTKSVRFLDPREAVVPNPSDTGVSRRFDPPLDDLGEIGKRETKRRRQYLRRLDDRSALRWDRKHSIDAAIQRIAKEIDDPKPPHRNTVHRWYKNWIKRGKKLAYIASGFHRRGGPGQGRFPDAVEEQIDAVIDQVYLTTNRRTAVEAWHILELRIKALNAERDLDQPLLLPSLRSFQRRISMLNKYEVMARREGERAARRHFRAVTGTLKVSKILARVEMDHTPLNLFVIDDKTMLPLGRPDLTVALDKKSRALLGYWMGFTGHGADAVLGCLSHAIRPKTYLAEKFPEIKLGWPCYGVPNVLALDNGAEFAGDDLAKACDELGIDVVFMPARRPEWKGSVERFLKTFNHALIHQIPGTTFENIAARGDYDPEKHAVITLYDLEGLIEMWICDVYHNEVHRGLNARPIDVWNQGVAAEEPALPSDITRLDYLLGESDERILQHYGVAIFSESYNCPELARVFAACGNIKVSVRYHRADIGHIWVRDPRTKEYIEVPNVNQEYASGLTLEQHDFIRARAKKDAKSAVDRDALLKAKAFIQSEIERLMAGTLRARRRAARLAGKNVGQSRKTKDVCSDFAQDQATRAAEAELVRKSRRQSGKGQSPNPTLPPSNTPPPPRTAPPNFSSRSSGAGFN